MRYDQARIHFGYGQTLRRLGRRARADLVLSAARVGFAAMGVTTYAERSDRELRAGRDISVRGEEHYLEAFRPFSCYGQPIFHPALPAVPMQVARLRELSAKTMWLTAAVITVLTAGAVMVLRWPATTGLSGAELATARLDALKIGLSVGVGSGGIVALYLAWRRQCSTEADLDNRERVLAHQQEVAAATISTRALCG
ncbi:hypothetical protein [Amycolatopsis sp. DG1A-15b]|uniref:hypothetical protein n=1 Tax=Amycolatopsis sp. DG1A-15b TaxID=3052846 RepID=UPI00255B8FE3|nr:hypothetical protein [Amycolatopsis sp. DG1A-15b]WIX92412.1 hypothetical protein QRY02_18980 [Amycolatopsis sp. DG1A-15b]